MLRPGQTFKKRQRENKLREKAQLKRERRQQRQVERKASQDVDVEGGRMADGEMDGRIDHDATSVDQPMPKTTPNDITADPNPPSQ